MGLVLAALFLSGAGLENHISDAPKLKYVASGIITDFDKSSDRVFVATETGILDIISYPGLRRFKTVTLPPFKNIMGGDVKPRLVSVSVSHSGSEVVIVSQGVDGYSDIYLCDTDGNLHKILDARLDKSAIRKAIFIDKETLCVGFTESRVGLFNLVNKRWLHQSKISGSAFSDMVYDPVSSLLYVADESGSIFEVDPLAGGISRELPGHHLDKVYQLGLGDKKIISGGRDRRMLINDLTDNSFEQEQCCFMVFAVAISPSGKKAAYSYNENSSILVLDPELKSAPRLLNFHYAGLVRLKFVGEDHLLSAAEEKTLCLWIL